MGKGFPLCPPLNRSNVLFSIILLIYSFAVFPLHSAQQWKDLQGRVIEATFIKFDGSTVTVNWQGRVVPLPLATLSPDSQALARKLASEEQGKGIHAWTDLQGRTLNARFIKADETTVTINWNGQVFNLPISTLREDSRKLAIKLRDESKPETSPSAPVGSAEPTDPNGPLDLDSEQIWESSDGKTVKGRFVDGNDANVTLSMLDGRREVVIPIEKLSPVSQELVRKLSSLARKKAKELAAFSKKRLKWKVPAVTEKDLDSEHDLNSTEGQSIRAIFVDANDELVTVLLSNNPTRPFELEWSRFSPGSQSLLEALRRKKEEIMPKNPKIVPARGNRLAYYAEGKFRSYNSVFQSALYDVALHYSGAQVDIWLKSPGETRNSKDGKRSNEKPIRIRFGTSYTNREDPERPRRRSRKITSWNVSPEPSMERELTSLSGTFENNGTFQYDMEINHRGLSFWGKVRDPGGEQWPTSFSIGLYSPNIAPQAVNLSMAEIEPIIGDGALYIDPLEEKRAKLPFSMKWTDIMRKFSGSKWNPIKSAELYGKPFGSHKIRVQPTNLKEMRFAWGKGYTGVFPFQGISLGYRATEAKNRGIIAKNKRLNVFITRVR